MMKAKECMPGQEVMIRAVVLKQENGQTLMWVPGVGRSGRWSVVNSVEVIPVGDLHAKMAAEVSE